MRNANPDSANRRCNCRDCNAKSDRAATDKHTDVSPLLADDSTHSRSDSHDRGTGTGHPDHGGSYRRGHRDPPAASTGCAKGEAAGLAESEGSNSSFIALAVTAAISGAAFLALGLRARRVRS